MAVDNEQRLANPPPDPHVANTIDQLVQQLALTRIWAGNPSHRSLTAQVIDLRRQRNVDVSSTTIQTVHRNTVCDMLLTSRRHARLDYDLLFDLLVVMEVPDEFLRWWREAWAKVFESRSYSKVISAVMGYGTTS